MQKQPPPSLSQARDNHIQWKNISSRNPFSLKRHTQRRKWKIIILFLNHTRDRYGSQRLLQPFSSHVTDRHKDVSKCWIIQSFSSRAIATGRHKDVSKWWIIQPFSSHAIATDRHKDLRCVRMLNKTPFYSHTRNRHIVPNCRIIRASLNHTREWHKDVSKARS